MKKKLLATFLALCMVTGLLPISAFAEGEGTLQAQINSASNGNAVTIKLGSNYTESITIGSGKNIILDLNGYTLTNESEKDTITVALGGTLTIQGSGTVDNVSHQCAAIYNNGTVILDGGSYTRSAEASKTTEDANGNSYYNILNHGVMTINEGVSVTSSGSFSSLIDNGYYSYNNDSNARVGYVNGTGQEKPSLVINGGTFSGGINTIKNDDNATLEINGGIFSNTSQAAVLNWNEATINGGEFSVTTDYAVVLNGRSNSTATDSEELINQGILTITNGSFTTTGSVAIGTMNGASGDMGEVEISGGNYTVATNGTPIQKYGTKATVTVSGGTFSEEINEDYLADTVTTTTDNGKTVVINLTEKDAVAKIGGTCYKTLAGAIAAAQAGDTVTLLEDVDVTAKYLVINKAITLDLNDKTIKINNADKATEKKNGYGILIAASVTLKNGSIVDTSSQSVSSNISIYVYGSAALTTEDLTVSAYNPPAMGYYNYLIYVTGGGALTLGSGTELKELENGTTVVNHENGYYGVVGAAVFGYYQTAAYNALDASANVKTTSAVINEGVTIETSEYAVSTNGSYHPVDLTINGGALTSSESTGIYFPGYGTLTIDDGEITGVTGIEIRAGELNMSGGTVTGTGSPIATAPNGNGTTSLGAGIAVAQHTTKLSITVNITGGSVNGHSALYESNPQKNGPEDIGKVNVTISGGEFKAINGGTNAVYSEDCKGFISGGIFSSNPSAYCAKDLTGVANTNNVTNSAYPFMVGAAGETAAQVVAGSPVAVSTVTGNDDNTKLASAAVNALAPKSGTPASIEGASVEAAAATVANENTESGEKYKNQLDDAETVYIVVERYMDIQVTGADATDDQKSLTLDITPMYRKVATTVNTTKEGADSIKTDGDNPNAVSIETGKLDITGPVTVTLPLPSDFVGSAETAYVQHKGYEYTATIENNVATFTNPHGFSEFTITLNSEAVASIGEESYTSLQAAVDAVQNGQTITLKQDGLSATVKGNKTFAVKSEEGKTYTANLTAAPGYTLKDNENGSYTITKKASSSSGSGTTTYAVNLPSDVTNGTLAASPKSAAKGATVTLTVTPAEGYQLATLTVTDANGNKIALTQKSDTQYTFTMPASKVSVQATFEEIPQVHVCPAEKFTDVDTTQWYHEAIDYVIESGMMNGVAADKFAPNSTTTRGMIVTILYRLEGEPAVSGSSVFTDVSDGTWYTDAVAWAAAKGVVNGTSPTTFDPNDPITREQMAAILYRYASYKGYDVAEKADLSSYTDAGQISAYAADPMAWANAQGLITGVTPTTLVPQGNATRAQVATILMRFCETVAK